MTHRSTVFLLSSLAGLLLFASGLVPTAWVEYLHAQGLFPVFRFLLSTPFSALPFSVSEGLILFLILGLLFSLGWATFGPARQDLGGRRGAWKRLGVRSLLLLALLLDLYLLGFGWLYQRAPLAERLALPEPSQVTGVMEAALEAQALETAGLARLSRVPLPKSPALADLSTRAQAALSAVLPALQTKNLPACRLKGAWPKGLLMHFSVSGIFSPFTQEAHLDPGLDALVLPFVAVHELAHLAGFAPEDEANFVAWLACTNSRDPWFRYSGHVAALARFESQATGKLRKKLREIAGSGVLADRRQAKKKADLHRNPTLSRLAWKTYDGILRSQGVVHGIKSYDLMTRLVLAWQASSKTLEERH